MLTPGARYSPRDITGATSGEAASGPPPLGIERPASRPAGVPGTGRRATSATSAIAANSAAAKGDPAADELMVEQDATPDPAAAAPPMAVWGVPAVDELRPAIWRLPVERGANPCPAAAPDPMTATNLAIAAGAAVAGAGAGARAGAGAEGAVVLSRPLSLSPTGMRTPFDSRKSRHNSGAAVGAARQLRCHLEVGVC
jgi:hypothetical protein